MKSKRLEAISTCHLVFELLHDGEGKIHPELEPIRTDAIIHVLRRRHGHDAAADAESWAKWFLASPNVGAPDERDSIKAALRIRKIERDAWRKDEDE